MRPLGSKPTVVLADLSPPASARDMRQMNVASATVAIVTKKFISLLRALADLTFDLMNSDLIDCLSKFNSIQTNELLE